MLRKLARTVGSIRSLKESHVVGAFFEHVADERADELLRDPHVVGQLAEGISGSIIQNSARCRVVLEFSARKRRTDV